MGLGDVPRVLWRGLLAFLRDCPRHGLCGILVFLPLFGVTYVFEYQIVRAYLSHPVLVGISVACVVGAAVVLFVGAIAKVATERFDGDTPEIVDLIEAMIIRPFTRAVLALLVVVLTFGLLIAVRLSFGDSEQGVMPFVVGSVLLLAACVLAVLTTVVILEGTGPWRTICRLGALMRGRVWFTLLSLIASVVLAQVIYTAFEFVYFGAMGSLIEGWDRVIIALITLSPAASMGAAIVHRLREIEASRSHQALADHFD